MKKVYKCRLSGTNILVKVNDKVYRLEFEPDVLGVNGFRGCSFATSNPAIQKAVESHPRFGLASREGIWTDDKEPEVVKAEIKGEVKEEVKPRRNRKQ